MKCSLGISNFLEEISSLSHSIVFLCFFALITKDAHPYERTNSYGQKSTMLTGKVCDFSIKGYQPSDTKAAFLCIFIFNENLEILDYCITNRTILNASTWHDPFYLLLKMVL